MLLDPGHSSSLEGRTSYSALWGSGNIWGPVPGTYSGCCFSAVRVRSDWPGTDVETRHPLNSLFCATLRECASFRMASVGHLPHRATASSPLVKRSSPFYMCTTLSYVVLIINLLILCVSVVYHCIPFSTTPRAHYPTVRDTVDLKGVSVQSGPECLNLPPLCPFPQSGSW
jgi:hypothetical protein